jgi:hypothetical protein
MDEIGGPNFAKFVRDGKSFYSINIYLSIQDLNVALLILSLLVKESNAMFILAFFLVHDGVL